jgi:predicted transport protein
MWTCPKCKRIFKRKDQSHSCILISKESLFTKRSPELKKLYDKIVKEVNKFGKYREETMKSDVIFFKTKSTFLGIKVKKDHLDIEFYLENLENVPPVTKYLQTSKNRVVHLVPIDQPEDINKQLISWIKRSYDLVSK